MRLSEKHSTMSSVDQGPHTCTPGSFILMVLSFYRFTVVFTTLGPIVSLSNGIGIVFLFFGRICIIYTFLKPDIPLV